MEQFKAALTIAAIFGVGGVAVITGNVFDALGMAVIVGVLSLIGVAFMRWADNKRRRELDEKQAPFLDEKRKEYEREEKERAERLAPFREELDKDREFLDRLRKK